MLPLPDHPYLSGAHTPLREELSAAELPVRGELPAELIGSFVRNSGTPMFAPKGRYHWFDGDGMVHAVHLAEGKARFANRWIDTAQLGIEKDAGESLWRGIMERPDPTLPGGPLKDTANTDVVWWQGKLLALWWLSGQPYTIDLATLDTLGPQTFDGTLKGRVSAHAKVCPTTGELLFFDYSVLKPPFYHHGVVGTDGRVKRYEPIATAGPRIPHDIAFTADYTVIPDLPLGWDPKELARGRFRIAFDRDAPSRWGILPRNSDGADIRWFELPASYVYHFCGCWQDGDKIVVIGCKIDDLIPQTPSGRGDIPRMDVIELVPHLARWEFDLATGAATVTQLDDRLTEFPRINDGYWGRPNRYSYNPTCAPRGELLFDGVIKYDLQTGASSEHRLANGAYGGEFVYAPRPGATDEDDGWLMTIVTAPTGCSELHVLDAQDVAAGPIAAVELPGRVPAGFHAQWCS